MKIAYWCNVDVETKFKLNPSRVRYSNSLHVLVGEFDVDAADVNRALSEGWFRFNRVETGQYDPCLDAKHAPSASVGDVFVVDDVAYRIEMVGFSVVPATEWTTIPKYTDVNDVAELLNR